MIDDVVEAKVLKLIFMVTMIWFIGWLTIYVSLTTFNTLAPQVAETIVTLKSKYLQFVEMSN